MFGNQSHADRVNPPATFYAGPGVSVKVWPANEKSKYPQALIEQSYQKEEGGEWTTNKVYIDNRILASLALVCQDAHRDVNRQMQQSRAEERTRYECQSDQRR
jgi:hypothetical protein